MQNPFHEPNTHGTSSFPLQVYSHYDKDKYYFVSQHWHNELEWLYVEQGTLLVTIHGMTYTLTPGQFCFINSGELHEIKSTGESLHAAIVFDSKLLDYLLYDECQHNFIRPLTSQKLLFASTPEHLSTEYQKKLLFYLKEIVRLYQSRPSCAVLSMKINILHVLELLFMTNSFQKNTATVQEKESLAKLKKVIEFIHENYPHSISLQTLAEINFMSPNYFSHYFHQEIGKPPITFINEYRIQRAAQLLSETELSISEVAVSVGFDNLSYFIRKFREYKKTTPGAYRLSC